MIEKISFINCIKANIFSAIILAAFSSLSADTIIKEPRFKTYVINLDRAPARLKYMKRLLDDNYIEFERVKAIDGYEIEITNLTTGEKFKGKDLKGGKKTLFDNSKYQINCGEESINFVHDTKFTKLSPGEMGCICSHRKVFAKLIKSDIDYAVVFEDDLKVKAKDFLFLLYSSLNNVRDNSIIYMDAWGPDIKDIKRNDGSGNLFIKLTKGPHIFGLYAIIYDKKFATNMLEKGKYEFYPIDISIGKYIKEKRVNAYLVNKVSAGYRGRIGSEINNMGRPH